MAQYRPMHENDFTQTAAIRARDEQQMQNLLQAAQYQANVYNPDIEPDHDTEYYCNCLSCDYRRAKIRRSGVQKKWSQAVMYPGEKHYNDLYGSSGSLMMSTLSGNPYMNITSPYGPKWRQMGYYQQRPQALYHEQNILATIQLNKQLNEKAVAKIDAQEPTFDIWASSQPTQTPVLTPLQAAKQGEKNEKQLNGLSLSSSTNSAKPAVKSGGFMSKLLGNSNNSDSNSGLTKTEKKRDQFGQKLAVDITFEEGHRWPDVLTKKIVADYQIKMGMTRFISELRTKKPIQYLHLLRAGYFEPIPVQWADNNSNPLKFSIEPAAGWRGVTPAWRGFEDTAEERLYWIVNHREPVTGARLKPDFISEMNMARERMATAVAPPPEYADPRDVCHVQHTSEGYSRQVLPRPFVAYDRPEKPSDDTMILLDVSGSMDFEPLRPVYDRYLIHNFVKSTQPKNKDVAKAIVRRFTDAMQHHDHEQAGYDLVTFSSQAEHLGKINHSTLDSKWGSIHIGGGTRVMTGWQMVKRLHFEKHRESAVYHPVFGWQAGPETPMLRLLLLLDGEAQDMDEFELDLLGLNWAHVTVFLIGVDGCLHHHRHANELQRISDSNHHVAFVDAQGNIPERYVTYELLQRHLGVQLSMQEFVEMEQLPEYAEV